MRRKIWFALLSVAILHFAFALAYLGRFPAWRAPDEGAHLAYVLHLVQSGSFPVFQGMGKGVTYEAHQPPLYYLTATPFIAPFAEDRRDHQRALYWLRGLSCLWGLFVVLGSFALTLQLFRGDPRGLPAAVLAGSFAALLPMHLLVCASAGNDATAGAMATLVLLWACHLSLSPPLSGRSLFRQGFLGGILCGMAVLTKMSDLLVFPLAFLAGLVNASFPQGHPRKVTRRNPKAPLKASPDDPLWARISLFSLALFGAFALSGGWWLGRNTVLYGDPLAARAFLEGFQASPKPSYFLEQLGLSLPLYLSLVTQVTFFTWLGIFGEPNEAVKGLGRLAEGTEPTVRWVIFCVLLGVLFLIAIAIGAITVLRRSGEAVRQKEWGLMVASLFPISLFALTLLSFIQFNCHFFQAQARYFYPAHAGVAYLFAVGVLRFCPKGREWLGVGVTLVSLILLASIVWWQWVALS